MTKLGKKRLVMKNKAHDLASYKFTKDETILFDANIWLYLFPAPSDVPPFFAANYSRALKCMMTAGVRFALDALVLSEYLNRYCRIEFNAQKNGMTFKQFRNSSDFTAVGKTAAAYSTRILKLCQRYDHPFSLSDMSQVLTNFEAGLYDFNDGLLADICRQNGWKFVTHDGDFTKGGIEILTTNPRLLAACK